MPQMTSSIQQLQQPSNHQMPGTQQGPPVHVPPGQAGRHIALQQGISPQMPQQATSTQIGLPQGHMGPSSAGPVASGGHVPTGTVVGLPPQMAAQQSSTLPGTQGSSIPAHISNTVISSQPAGVVPTGAGSGPIPATSQALSVPQVSNVSTMQGMVQIPVVQPMPFQPTPASTTANDTSQDVEDTKPRTAELISFD